MTGRVHYTGCGGEVVNGLVCDFDFKYGEVQLLSPSPPTDNFLSVVLGLIPLVLGYIFGTGLGVVRRFY